ncbi:MAG TPA: hypothetical protein VM534_09975 [Thermoanaerobaculia bacterium]|nr:hypothetical protein [Thermoanaerobaculia bacterium]
MNVATLEKEDTQTFAKPEVETGSQLKSPPERSPLPDALPLFESTLGGSPRRLRRAIGLKVRREEGFVFVENETLDLFGHGPTLEDAVAEFRQDLDYYWRYYSGLSDDQVTGHGARLKQIYSTLFE